MKVGNTGLSTFLGGRGLINLIFLPYNLLPLHNRLHTPRISKIKKIVRMNWREIEQYNGAYMINEVGDVKSVDRLVITKTGCSRLIRSRAISCRVNNFGYATVRLSKDGKTSTCFVHRLVARAFIDNPDNLPQINHLSGDKLDNSVSNLEWVDASKNANHAYANGLNKHKGQDHIYSASIIDRSSGLIFPTIKSFCQFYSIPYSTGRNMLNGNIKVPRELEISLYDIEKVYNH